MISLTVSINGVLKLLNEPFDVPNASLSYLLTYKFNQDHLEIFFAVARLHGGFSINLTVGQFVASYKLLLMRQDIQNRDGYCLIIDNTKILHVRNTTRQFPLQESITC